MEASESLGLELAIQLAEAGDMVGITSREGPSTLACCEALVGIAELGPIQSTIPPLTGDDIPNSSHNPERCFRTKEAEMFSNKIKRQNP